MDIVESLEILRSEAQDIVSMSDELEHETVTKIEELDSLRERFENISSNIAYYVGNMENLQSAIEDFDNARDDASNLEIGL